VSAVISRVQGKIQTDLESVAADKSSLLKAFRTMRSRFPEEYAMFGLAQLLPAMASPVIRRSLAGWRPLESPTEPAAVLASWKAVLTDVSGGGEVEREREREREQAAFSYLANELVLPPVRSSLLNDWDVKDATPAVDLVKALVKADVGDGIVQSLLDQA
ncbi:unnamed protein product, partial [Discosporangium mesarthrocarpum]